MIIMDSGLGGVSVLRAMRSLEPSRPIIYLADTAGFPYGRRSADELNARAGALLSALIAQHGTGCVVLACNTLSTLCLAHLRAVLPCSVVGTVPAVKTAAQTSKTRRFTLLATPNTAHSSYSAELIAQFAQGCVVDCYGAPNLASMAEAYLLGHALDELSLSTELLPAFKDDAHGKTDTVVLGCTHYPLIVEPLRAASPWPVAWVDSSDAIARRALSQPGGVPVDSIAYVTSDTAIQDYGAFFAREGFAETRFLAL